MNFVFFSTLLWDWVGGVHHSPQVSRELARRGHQVLFIQPRPSISLDTSNLPIRILSLADLGLSERLIERAWHGLSIGSLEAVAKNLLAALHDIEQPDQPRIAVWFSPFDPFARLLPLLRATGYQPIYYPQDDFPALIQLGFYRHNAEAENYLGREAETIFTLSQPVAQKMRRFGKQVCVIPDGINLDAFRYATEVGALPPNILRGERTLGFWGWISDSMVDAEMLAYVARERPRWAINLLGTVDPEAPKPSLDQRLKDFQNIRFHGGVPHQRLREYASFFDACIIPAPDNDFSHGRDPIKVYEYLALHKPVICTHMPQLARMPYVRVAFAPREFLQEIEIALNTPIDPQVIDEFIAKQTWPARVDVLLDLINPIIKVGNAGALAAQASLPLGSLVAASFVDESPGLRAYLTRLETDLERTRHWAKELERVVIAKDRELEQIYNLFPIRLARKLRRLL